MVMDAVGSAVSAVGQALGLVKTTKAKLACMGPNLPAGDHEIECMFNPTEYRLSQTLNVTHNRATARVGGTPEFSGTNAMTLTTQLFFDDFASAKGDVTPKITTLLSWTHPTEDSSNNGQPCPPLVAFKWGGNPQLDSFFGFLNRVSVNYTVFRLDGTPIQAKVDIDDRGAARDVRAAEPDLAGDQRRRVHTMIDGDTLQSVAFQELGKPTYWRAIAELNDIDDPMRLAPGTTLLIPSVADATRTT